MNDTIKEQIKLSSSQNIIIQQNNKVKTPYSKINAYTHKPSFLQILTILLFLTNFTMHCIFVIRPVFKINHSLLYFMWAIFLVFLLFVIFDYCNITCGDPVDQLIKDPQKVQVWKMKQRQHQFKRLNSTDSINRRKKQKKRVLKSQNPFQLKQCQVCDQLVKYSSYHCWTCKRCVQDMDHHCKYLNNCIGGKNYYAFFRLLSFVIAYFLSGVAVAIWVFVSSSKDNQVNSSSVSRWAVLMYIIYTLALSIVVQILYYFHCYISLCLGITTVQYLYRDLSENNSQRQKKSKKAKNQQVNNE